MKQGVIWDIHGNLPALTAMMKDLKKQVTHEWALYDIQAFKEDLFNRSLDELAPTWAK